MVLFKLSAMVDILILSDHGNIEDLAFVGHNRNSMPLIFISNLVPYFSIVNGINEIFHSIFSKVFNTALY